MSELFGLLRAPREILFAPGAVAAIPRVLAAHGRRVFICVDRALVDTAAFLDAVRASRASGLDVCVFYQFAPRTAVERHRRRGLGGRSARS